MVFDLDLKRLLQKGDQLHDAHRVDHTRFQKGRIVLESIIVPEQELVDDERSHRFSRIHERVLY